MFTYAMKVKSDVEEIVSLIKYSFEYIFLNKNR